MIRNRETLLKELQELSFRLYDLALFLDTHPDECSALELYHSTMNKYKAMVCNFEKLYGPLTLSSPEISEKRWNWTKGPWPWENQCCEEACN